MKFNNKDFLSSINNKEFIIYLQPKINIQQDELVGVEALVRWNRNGEIILPDKFVPFLEENELINILDLYVLERVFKILNNWKEKNYKLISISVNESRLELNNKNYLKERKKLIDKYKVNTNYIELEMTESTLVKNIDLAKESAEEVHKLGFKISLDDFGTGYSSFGVLKDIDIDILKIDKSLFKDILVNNRGRIIVESIIKMAHKLNMKVVAEGIENKEQINFLKEIKCDIIQGYVYDKPIKTKDFETKYLRKN